MYAPRQRQRLTEEQRKRPYSSFLALAEMEGPIMAPPVYSITGDGLKKEEEETSKETAKDTKPADAEQAAVQNNRNNSESEGPSAESESSTSEAPVQRKAVGRRETPPQFKLKASSPRQFKFADGPTQFKLGSGGGGGAGSGGVAPEVMGKMESAMGADFSGVQIHQNSQKATEAGALAYAQGNDIHFAPGQFSPDTPGGQQLLGHELAHVVQQRQGRVQPTGEVNGMAANTDKSLEAEADAMGAKAAQMKVASPASSPVNTGTTVNSAAVQRKEDPAAEKESAEAEGEGKDKKVEEPTPQVQNSNSLLALDGFKTREDDHEQEATKENEGAATGKGDVKASDDPGAQPQAEAQNETAEGADQVPTSEEQTAANPEAAAEPQGQAEAPVEDQMADAAESEQAENEAQTEDTKEEAEGKAEDAQNAAKDEAGAEGEAEGKEGEGEEGKEGKGEEGAAGAGGAPAANAGEGGGAPAVETAAKTEVPPAIMGDFGASEPAPELTVMPEALAASIPAENIVMRGGDGSVVVKGGADLAEQESEMSESEAPIQMAPDPDDKPKKKPKKPVQKVDPQIAEAIQAKKRQDCADLVAKFKSENEGKLTTLTNLKTTIAPGIQAKATEAKATVEASVQTNRQAIADDIALKQETARGEATRQEGVIQGQYDAIIIKIQDFTEGEKKRIQEAYDTNEINLTTLETNAITAATDSFNKAEADARQAGKDECASVDSRIAALMSGYTDPEEKVVSAMRQAALDTGKAFKDKLTESANGVADEIPKGKEAFIQGIKDKIKEAREKTKAYYDAAIQLIDGSHQGAIDAADANLQGQKDAVKQALDGTIQSLTDLQTAKVQEVEDAGIAACDNIDKTAAESIKGVEGQLDKAISDIQALINDTVTQASGQANAEPDAIKQLLDGVSGNITTSIADNTASINQGITDSGASLVEQAAVIDADLIDMAAKAAEASQGLVDGLIGIYTEQETSSQKVFDDSYTRHETDAKKAVDDNKKEIEKVVKDTDTGFKTAQQGLDQQFTKKVSDLKADLKKITSDLDAEVAKNVKEAADKAREPWWKTALKWVVTIVVMIAVTALIIAFCPLTLGGLLLAFAIGAVGAVVALFLKDLIDGQFHSLKEYLVEAIAGGIGGVFTLLGGKLGEMAGVWLLGTIGKGLTSAFAKFAVKFAADVIVGTICDTIGSGILEVAKNLMLGKEVSWGVFFKAMKDNALNNFLGNFGGSLLGAWIGKTKIGQTIARWMGKGSGEVVEEVIESTTKETTEAVVENTTKETVEAVTENTTKETTEAVVENSTKETTEAVVESEVKNTTEEVVESEVKNTTEEVVESEVKNTTEEVAESEVKNTTEEVVESEVKNTTEGAVESEVKNVTEEVAEQEAKKTGAQLAEDLGYPKAPDGYHWRRNGDSPTPILSRDPHAAATHPPMKYDPDAKRFMPEVEPPTGYYWKVQNDKVVLSRKPNMADSLPKLEYDPTSPSGFKNLDTGHPYISHLDVRDAIKARIDGNPSAKLTLDDNQIKALIDKGQSLGFSRADIDAMMMLAARKHWVNASTLQEVMEMLAAKRASNAIPFKPGWDFMMAWREGQNRLLAGGKLAPEEYLDPSFIASHLNQFSGKASYVVTTDVFIRRVEGQPMVGRPDGQFLSSAADIDEALRQAAGDPRKLEQILGFPNGHFGNGGVVRVDVLNPETLNPRLPSGIEGGANEFWIPGGQTSGGAVEIVTDQIPQSNLITNTVIPPNP